MLLMFLLLYEHFIQFLKYFIYAYCFHLYWTEFHGEERFHDASFFEDLKSGLLCEFVQNYSTLGSKSLCCGAWEVSCLLMIREYLG
jgi:hypothetical protein